MRVNHHTSEQNLLRRRRFHINRDYNSKKNKCFFVVVLNLRQMSIISSQKKGQINELKYIFLLVDDGSIFLYTFCLCHVSMRVNSDAILNVAIIVRSNIDIFMVSPIPAGVVLSKKLRFCMNFYFSEFLFSDKLRKKNLYVCHSFDKTEIKANFTSIHVNYDENGKTEKQKQSFANRLKVAHYWSLVKSWNILLTIWCDIASP